jgi:hypothetical protein
MRRLDRRERWVSLWLARVVAFLFVFENTGIERALHARIERFVATLSDCVLDLIAMRATWTPGYQKRVAKAGLTGVTVRGMKRRRADPRALLGGALRRALKANSLKGRVEALLRVLKNRDFWVAYLARRIARGQTRIYSSHSRVAKTLPPCHAEAQCAQAGLAPSPSKLSEDLRGAVGPP